MRRWLVLAPMLVVSFAFFLAAALLARSDAQAILLAMAGAAMPALGFLVLALVNMQRWRRMGRDLGLVARESGAYPDLEGRYQGRRLIILRRTNIYGVGPRLTTVIRLEGTPEVRLPGLVADAGAVRSLVEPLLHA